MRKVIIFLIVIILGLIFGLFFGRKSLSSYLLTRELSSDAEVEKIISQKDQGLDYAAEAVFNNRKIDYLSQKPDLLTQISKIEGLNNDKNVLGSESDRWIEINLSEQRLNAWEGGNKVYSYLVSTGKWALTPTGDFKIWTKLAKTTMSGGSKALGTYYYLPNVPCTMYFYKGYGIHGTYWHNNFGQPMSHGCVNMKTEEACTLFSWASVGTRVNVHN